MCLSTKAGVCSQAIPTLATGYVVKYLGSRYSALERQIQTVHQYLKISWKKCSLHRTKEEMGAAHEGVRRTDITKKCSGKDIKMVKKVQFLGNWPQQKKTLNPFFTLTLFKKKKNKTMQNRYWVSVALLWPDAFLIINGMFSGQSHTSCFLCLSYFLIVNWYCKFYTKVWSALKWSCISHMAA